MEKIWKPCCNKIHEIEKQKHINKKYKLANKSHYKTKFLLLLIITLIADPPLSDTK